MASAREEASLRRIRERARLLVACGSCACFGGVSAMDAAEPRDQVIQRVYGDCGTAFDWDIGRHRPLSDIVKVDAALPGCPIEKQEFVRAVASLLNGDAPLLPAYPVCLECKMDENDCLLVNHGLPCAGPVTSAGCGARCPACNVACIGCRGPVGEANISSLEKIMAEKNLHEEEIRRKLRTFAAPVLDREEKRGWA